MFFYFVLAFFFLLFFFFNDTATTEIYTLSLHDALPIFYANRGGMYLGEGDGIMRNAFGNLTAPESGYIWDYAKRSEEHTSELQSRQYLVCRLLLEKKKKKKQNKNK